MKKRLLAVFACWMMITGTTEVAIATTFDFNDESNLGVTLSGSMEWNGVGGGHLLMENYFDADYIIFSNSTYVNSFQMNYHPWQGYQGGYFANGAAPVVVEAFDSDNNSIWKKQLSVDSTWTDWTNWVTVSVETDNVVKLVFGPMTDRELVGAGQVPGYWPSIDNLVINDKAPVPVPASILLLGSGLAGLVGSKIRRKKKA